MYAFHIYILNCVPETPQPAGGTDLFPSAESKDLQTTGLAPPGTLPSTKPATTAPTQPEVAAFMGQPLQGNTNSPPDFADFKSATTNSDGFADFQAAPVTSGGSAGGAPAGGDRFAALKALVSDNKLYKGDEKPTDGSGSEEKAGDGEEDWAEFSSIRDTSKDAGAVNQVGSNADKYNTLSSGLGGGSGVFGAPAQDGLFNSNKKPQKQKELFPDDEDTEEWGGFNETTNTTTTNWADFTAAPPAPPAKDSTTIKGITDEDWSQPSSIPPIKPSAADWALNSSKNESDLTNFGTLTAPKVSEPKNKDTVGKPYSTTNKKFNLFARNLEATTSGVTAGTGMSPLDFQPPELPDCKDDEDLDDFDKFGTFHGVDADVTSTTGISSLGAPFGGMDDVNDVTSSVDMFGYVGYRSRDAGVDH